MVVVHASAPHSLFAIGAGTDTAHAEYGDVFCCAEQRYARVTLIGQSPNGFIVHHSAPQTKGRRFVRDAARYFALDSLEVWIDEEDEDGTMQRLSPAAAVAVTGALACCAGRSLSPHYLALIAQNLASNDDGMCPPLYPYLTAAHGGLVHYSVAPYPRAFARHLELPPAALAALEQALWSCHFPSKPASPPACHHARRDLVLESDVLHRLRALAMRMRDALAAGRHDTLAAIFTEQHELQGHLFTVRATLNVDRFAAVLQRHAGACLSNSCENRAVIYCPAATEPETRQIFARLGYRLRPVKIDTIGLRVWGHDPQCARAPHPMFEPQKEIHVA